MTKRPLSNDLQTFDTEEKIYLEEVKQKLMKKVKANFDKDVDEKLYIAPWITNETKSIKNSLARLHNEIIDFYDYISPDEQRHSTRLKALDELKAFLLKNIKNIEIKTFGSFETKLYLPDADIDLVVIQANEDVKYLIDVIGDLLHRKTDRYTNVTVIRSAKVPIVKLTEKENNLNFDISFNKLDGIKQLEEISIATTTYPELKYLIMVLKVFLRQRDMHETYTGGIGSFLLFCMILAFLRHIRQEHIATGNKKKLQNMLLSEYLLSFLEYYASKFDLKNSSIFMTNGGQICQKKEDDIYFSLISPQDPNHDLGSAAYKIREVFAAFKNRYIFLTHCDFKQNESILKYLINPSLAVFSHMKRENKNESKK